MAVFYTHNSMKEDYFAAAKADCNLLVVVKAPVKSDTYAAFMAKVIAQAGLVSGDWTETYTGENLRVTTNAKTSVDPSGAALDTDDICVAAVDTVNEIVYICQDATDRVVTNEVGDTVTIPGLNILLPELVVE